MHRIKRIASGTADNSYFNPFARIRQRKRAMHDKHSVSSQSSGDTATTAVDSGDTSNQEAGSVAPGGPNRVNTTQLENGSQPRPFGHVAKTWETASQKKQHLSLFGQLKATLFNSYINVLIVAAPIGIALHYAGVSPVAVFVVNFIAIIPLAAMLSYGTEQIALYAGEVLGGLLNASFGNAVELIVSILALVKKEITIVQTSLIGSILSNLLLVLGMAFFGGGWTRIEQNFNTTVAQTASSLLALAVGGLIVPTAFHLASDSDEDAHIVQLSRGTAVVLLFVYGFYLYFQLNSHKDMYNAESVKVPKRDKLAGQKSIADIALASAPPGVSGLAIANKKELEAPEEEEKEEPDLTLYAALIVLVASTALVAICSECLVDSIDYLVSNGPLGRVFVGLILLPIVGNAAEHATAVTVACKDKMDLAIGVAIGSSMQIALLVIPFIVVLGWICGIDSMTMYFDGFQVMILFVTIVLVNYIIQDGKSNYLEGILLMALYVIIGVAAFFYPKSGPLSNTSAATR